MYLVTMLTDEDWNMGMMDDIITHTAPERSTEGTMTTASTDDQISLVFLCCLHYGFSGGTNRSF